MRPRGPISRQDDQRDGRGGDDVAGSSNSTTLRRLHLPQYATMHRDIGAIAHGFHLLKDGGVWLAVGPEFVDLVRSPAGFGDTREKAVRELRARLRMAGIPTTPCRGSASSRSTTNDPDAVPTP
jgi:hypothetical protein